MIIAVALVFVVAPSSYFAGSEFVTRHPELFKDNSADEIPEWVGGIAAALFPPLAALVAILMIIENLKGNEK